MWMSGLRLFIHLARHFFPVLPGSPVEIVTQFPSPWSATISLSLLQTRRPTMDGSDRCRVMLCTLKTVCCKQGAMYVSNPNQGISSSESQNMQAPETRTRKKNSGTPKISEVARKHGILKILVKFQKFWVKFKQIWIFSFKKTRNSPILFVSGLTGKHVIPGISVEFRQNFFPRTRINK
jgi:hypothetical protein